MATDHNFRIKNGLTVGAVEVIDSSGKLTEAAFGTNSNEKIEDVVADMITGSTHSNITVTYNDTNGTLAFSAAAQYGDSDVESYLDSGVSTPSFASISSGAISLSGGIQFNGYNANGVNQINGTGSTGWLDFNMDTDSVYPQSTSDNQTVLGSVTHMNFVGDSNGNGTGGRFYWGYGTDGADSGTFTTTMDLDRSGNLTTIGAIDATKISVDSGASLGLRVHTNSGITASNNYMNFFTGQTSGWSFNANATGADSDSVFTISPTGTITATSLNTGHGDNELYAMNQNVRTTDAVTFSTVNTGHGDNELYPMNQAVRTTDAVTFNQVITTNNGSGTNFKVSDDAWIGDINVANTIRVSGVQNANNGYIAFGNSSTTALGRAGTGQLTWGTDEIYHEGHKPTYAELGTMAYSNLTGTPTIPSLSGYATETYVNTAVSNLVDSAPGSLDTLNELAAALGDDANFSTTVTNSIATKLPLAGGTMTGQLIIDNSSANPLELKRSSQVGIEFNDTSVGSRYLGVNGGNLFFGAALNHATNSKVFHDTYHPNADKWTTARSHTVTLTGEVTGTATQTVDGTGNKTWSIATTLNNSSLDDQYLKKDGANIQGYAAGTAEMFTWQNTTSGGKIQLGLQQNDTDGLHHRAYIKAYKGSASASGNVDLIVRGSGGSITSDVLELHHGQRAAWQGNDIFTDDYHPNADKWTTSRTLTLGGDLSGSVSFDGSADFTLTAAVADDSHNHIISNVDGLQSALDGKTSIDHFRHTGHGNYTSTTTSALLTEALGDDAFDSKLTAHKTGWSYAGNGDLTDAGRLTELAGTSWLWWTDDSSDNVQGNITGLCIAPTTGGSAGKVFIYNNQSSSYSPGWREVWTSTSDGASSGLDADLLDGQEGSYYLNYNNFTNTPSASANYYLDGISKSGNTLTFSVNGATNQTYAFGSNAFNSTTIPTNNNQLTNGAGYTSNVGDITGVTAGTGMTGGGTSGAVTLNVIGGSGITANADNITVDSTVVRTTGTQTIGGIKVSAVAVDQNYIAFSGTTGDQNGNYNHTFIGERIWGGTEQSELVLAKYNDIEGSSGSDRIRHIANNHVFDTYTGATSAGANASLSTAVGTGTLYTRMTIRENGDIEVGGSKFIDSSRNLTNIGTISSGVITATGGNSTNWNTAYGWGNHASAGYTSNTGDVTSVTATSPLSVSDSGGPNPNIVFSSPAVTTSTSDADGDFFLVHSGTTSSGSLKKLTKANINISGFNNDSGYTTYTANQAVNTSSAPTFSGLTTNDDITFNNSGTTKRGIRGTMGDNDMWFVGGGATASNAGYMEIAIGDDGQTSGSAEQMYFSQYGPGSPWSGTLYRRHAMFDENGQTIWNAQRTPTTVTSILSDASIVINTRSGSHNYIQLRNDSDDGTHAGLVFTDNNHGGSVLFTNHSTTENTANRADTLHLSGYQGVDIRSGTGDASVPSNKTRVARFATAAIILDKPTSVSGNLGITGSFTCSTSNTTGGGIILADDGDIVDLNDAYCSMRFSYGVRIYSGNKTGTAQIALKNNGEIIANSNITAYGSASDERLKENIETIKDPIKKVQQLRGVTFDYKKDGSKSTGLIAQELEKVLPEVVYETVDVDNDNNKYKAVRYGNTVGLLVEAIKEQQEQIEELKQIINTLVESK